MQIREVYVCCNLAIEAAKGGRRLAAYHHLLAAQEVAQSLASEAHRKGRFADYDGAFEAIAEAAAMCRLYSAYSLDLHLRPANDTGNKEEPQSSAIPINRKADLWMRSSTTGRAYTTLPKAKPRI